MTSAAPTSASPTTVALSVSGMKCAGCVSAVERRLCQQVGVQTAAVNLVAQLAVVAYDPNQTDAERLAAALSASGFPSQPRSATEPLALWAQAEPPLQQQAGPLAIAALLVIFAFLGHLPHAWTWPAVEDLRLHALLASFALLGPGRSILVSGWRGLRQGLPNMNSLVGLGAVSAYAASLAALFLPQLGWACFFEEPVMLLGFILLGRTLEAQARYRAGQSLRELAALQPHRARLLLPTDSTAPVTTADPQVEVGVTTLKPGELLLVLPGESFPVDGDVISGCSSVNEAMLSGEALPCLRQVGDGISTGTVNLTAPLIVRATRTGLDTTLAQILRLVEEAQGRKAPIQRLADQVAGRFAWGVMTVALATFLFWMLWGTHLWPTLLSQSVLGHVGHLPAHSPVLQTPLLFSLQRAIAVLVVACPCALGLATPTAILVASGIGAERGLLLRGGDVLEQIAGLTDIVFDKTGTLTLGQPQLRQIEPQPGYTARQLLQWAASLEVGTHHPLATAVIQAAQAQRIPLLASADSLTEPGFGVAGTIEGQAFCLGQHRWLLDRRLTLPEQEDDDTSTWLYLASDDCYLGRLAVTDAVRPNAASVVAALQQQGLQLHLLTGDRPSVAQQVASQVGIALADVQAALSPAQKASRIEQLQQSGGRVGMVGDGINDAPALAVADVGFAMGGGTDVARASGDVILTGDRLDQVLEAIQLSRSTLSTIRLNLLWAFAYNLLGIPLAAGILLPWQGLALSPSLAGALMAASSLSVVANSLSLYRRWPSPPASPASSSGHLPATAVADLQSADGSNCHSSAAVPHS